MPYHTTIHEKKSASRSALFNLRVLFGFVLSSVGVFLALLSLSIYSNSSASAAGAKQTSGVIVGASYHNDVSVALRDQPAAPVQARQEHEEANLNPLIANNHKDAPDLVVDKGTLLSQLAPSIPRPILQFAGIPFPGVSCGCIPPDTNGEVGTTQYVQMVNTGYQVFNKATGASVLGPNSIESLWAGLAVSARLSALETPLSYLTKSPSAGLTPSSRGAVSLPTIASLSPPPTMPPEPITVMAST